MLLVIYVTYYSHFQQRAAKTKARHSEPGQRRRQPGEASAPAPARAAAPAAAPAAPAPASGEPQATNWMQSQPPPPVGWEWPREGEVIEVEVVHSVEKQKHREEAVPGRSLGRPSDEGSLRRASWPKLSHPALGT